jgi:hypothetical protein
MKRWSRHTTLARALYRLVVPTFFLVTTSPSLPPEARNTTLVILFLLLAENIYGESLLLAEILCINQVLSNCFRIPTRIADGVNFLKTNLTEFKHSFELEQTQRDG